MAQALEYLDDLLDLSSAHFLGVFLVATLPVPLEIDPGIAQQRQHSLDVPLRQDGAQANRARVGHGNHHRAVVREDAERVVGFSVSSYMLLKDVLDDSDAMVGINDLVADLELQTLASFQEAESMLHRSLFPCQFRKPRDRRIP